MSPWRDERASAVVELTVMVPAVVLLLVFVVFAGRVTAARLDVAGAAADAARAASTRQHAGDAASDARATAAASLADRGVTCARLAVDVDTGAFTRGGSVAVTVRCTVDLSDLGLLGVPAARTVSARSTEVIDSLRGD